MFLKHAVFNREKDVTQQGIIRVGEEALVCLYGGQDEGLDGLRYRRFCEKVAQSTMQVEPQTLPPTSSTTKYHSLRVYYQVMQGKGKYASLKPKDWG